jgi:hypothetical protein
LNNAASFTVGDRILIDMATGSVQRKVTTKSTNEITINEALTGTPPTNTVVKVMIGARGLKKSTASGMAYVEKYVKYKDANTTINGDIKVDLRGN